MERINEPAAAALGYFDGVHLGHAAVIKKAAEQNLKTAVITFLNNPGKRENDIPVPEITSPALKEKIFAGMNVDITAYLDFERVCNMSPEEFMELLTEKFNLKYISCGFNYKFGKNAVAGTKELENMCLRRGIGFASVNPVCVNSVPVSSTTIRAMIAAGDIETANKLLGRPFAFYGRVVHGKELGRTLGVPTLNQQLSSPQLLPRFGVYASVTRICGRDYPSVTNVGVKPTVENVPKAGAETHIPGFSGDLYGDLVEVKLVGFIRPEMKFSSVNELKNQMRQDAKTALLRVKEIL